MGNAAFAAAEAGEHAALAPVNSDTQAAQIATSYIADTEDVAAAKAAFQAAFDDAAAGGLAAKQAPAPVHTIPAPAPLAAAPVATALPFAIPLWCQCPQCARSLPWSLRRWSALCCLSLCWIPSHCCPSHQGLISHPANTSSPRIKKHFEKLTWICLKLSTDCRSEHLDK